jgi:hypothetical protein
MVAVPADYTMERRKIQRVVKAESRVTTYTDKSPL